MPETKKTVVLVTRDGLGTVGPADAPFGREMMDLFLHTLEAQQVRPVAICFYTDGVKLACTDSPLVPALRFQQELGVRIILCRSCLAYFGLSGDVAVGEVGGMKDIVALLMAADSVVTV